MCGFTTNEAGYRSLIRELVNASKRYDNLYGQSLMISARIHLQQAQRRGWLMDYDPATCEKRVPAPTREAPVYREGMKVVREAIKEAEKLPAPAERKVKASA